MELFYSKTIEDQRIILDREESEHCVRVLRHKPGDEISVIDGKGTLFRCKIEIADSKSTQATIISSSPDFGAVPYRLTMAVCPTKNATRYEWFVEKATEFGVDAIVPILSQRSERKNLNIERLSRILLSACKQSLKAKIPQISPTISFKEYIKGEQAQLKLICCCFEPTQQRISIAEVLASGTSSTGISILIGPEGDFTPEELQLAIDHGWLPVSLGESRLRTETAAIATVSAVYLHDL